MLKMFVQPEALEREQLLLILYKQQLNILLKKWEQTMTGINQSDNKSQAVLQVMNEMPLLVHEIIGNYTYIIEQCKTCHVLACFFTKRDMTLGGALLTSETTLDGIPPPIRNNTLWHTPPPPQSETTLDGLSSPVGNNTLCLGINNILPITRNNINFCKPSAGIGEVYL